MSKSDSIKVGDRFGAWTVVGPHYIETRASGKCRQSVRRYPCRCDCGTERDVRAFKLLSNSRSCGCLTSRLKSVTSTRHGHNRLRNRTRLYSIWSGMVQRCTNPNAPAYRHYGGRGISMPYAWREFGVFRDWAEANGYREGLEVDRADNEKGYSPNNCRWVTHAENARNTRSNVKLTIGDETKCIAEWARDPRCAVADATIRQRLEQNWPAEAAVFTPSVRGQKSHPFR